MAASSCDLLLVEDDAGTLSKLTNAWVYWREAGTLSVLRSDATGQILAFGGSGDATRPAAYTARFTTNIGARVNVFASRGAKPIPNGVVTPFLQAHVVELGLAAEARTGPIPASVTAGGSMNSLRRLPLGKVKLPLNLVALTTPAELSLWPVLQELLTEPTVSGTSTTAPDPYYTQGFPQSTAWLAQPRARVRAQENAAAPAAAAFLQVGERGLRVTGTIAAGATAVRLSVLNAAGNPINLRPRARSSASVTFVRVAPGATSGKQKAFSTALFFADAANAFGPIQLLVESEGVTPTHASAFAAHLVGLQCGLVEDSDATAGAAINASADLATIDYTKSPDAARSVVQGSSRIRRMLAFAIHTGRARPFLLPGTTPPRRINLIQPEMPAWMAEAQLVGISRAELEDLMTRRQAQLAAAPGTTRFGLSWDLSLQWDGPDKLDSGFSSSTSWTATQNVTLRLDNNANQSARRLLNVSSGVVRSGFDSAQSALTFPGRRRAPSVLVAATRAWGREVGAVSRPSLVIQWPPSNAGAEELHVGNGLLSLTFSIDGAAVDSGAVLRRPTNANAPAPDNTVPNPSGAPPPADRRLSTPPANTPHARLPAFRVRGDNPSRTQLAAVVDVLVADFIANNTQAWLSWLTVAEWQDLARRVCGTESGFRHFAVTGFGDFLVIITSLNGLFYGKPRDQPTFGPPHGYGMGQRDPPSSKGVVFSYAVNAAECVSLLLKDKAQVAFNRFTRRVPAALRFPTAAASLTRRQRNIFARETVRLYNGGTEFIVTAGGTDVEIQPSSLRPTTIFYCDNVLGTNVGYETLLSTPNPRAPTAAPAPPTATSIPYVSGMFTL